MRAENVFSVAKWTSFTRCLVLCLALAGGVRAGAGDPVFALRGIKLWVAGNLPGMYNEYTGQPLIPRNYYKFSDVLDKVKADGANHVILQVSLGIMALPTDNSYLPGNNNAPPMVALQGLARDLKARGLGFAVSVFANVQNVISGSTGTLDRPSPTNRAAWFSEHRLRVLEWARISQELGASDFIMFQDEVQLLVAAPELESSWLGLIRDVRAVFSGKVTSAFWTPGNGTSITSIPASIIEQLDYLGVGFFPNLVRGEEPSTETLVAAYTRNVGDFDPLGFLRDLSVRYNKKIWITDKAFHSFSDAGADETRVFTASVPLTPSEDMQARLYESFFQVMGSQSAEWFHGVSFQNFNNIVPGAFSIARFVVGPYSESPQNKKAELVMSDWFNGRRTAAVPTFLANLSVRAALNQGQTLIVGFSVAGGATPVLLRAAGPVLTGFGLPGVGDPRLTIFNASGGQVMTNDNWSSALAGFFTQVGAFAWPAASRDAAALPTLSGTHTVHASAAGNGTVLVEAYNAGRNVGPQLSNLSARYRVGGGSDILIAGFAVGGSGQKRLLVRAVGPKLADFGVANFLARPRLAIYEGSAEITNATGWTPDLAATFNQVGAFGLNAGSADAALAVTLGAGRTYTVQVSGVGGDTGEALVEIYALP